jgi:hypothetical protein
VLQDVCVPCFSFLLIPILIGQGNKKKETPKGEPLNKKGRAFALPFYLPFLAL